MTLDGKQIFDNWDLVRAFQPAITLPLTAGSHTVVVEAKQGGLFGGHLRFGIAPVDSLVNPRAKLMVAKADVVIVAAGFDHASESEGGDRTFALPFGQDQLIQAMAAANKKTVVTITSGGNVDSEAWLKQVPAALETWYAGQSGGTALAEILFGDVNPSGHLPATFERRAEDNPTFNHYYPDPGTKNVRYTEGLFVGYRGYEHTHTKPLFPFGYGPLLHHLRLLKPEAQPRVRERQPAGHRHLRPPQHRLPQRRRRRPGLRLRRPPQSPTRRAPAQRLSARRARPGESKSVSVTLDARAFAFYDVAAKKWSIDPGKFTIHVGDNAESTPLHGTLSLTGQAASSNF